MDFSIYSIRLDQTFVLLWVLWYIRRGCMIQILVKGADGNQWDSGRIGSLYRVIEQILVAGLHHDTRNIFIDIVVDFLLHLTSKT